MCAWACLGEGDGAGRLGWCWVFVKASQRNDRRGELLMINSCVKCMLATAGAARSEAFAAVRSAHPPAIPPGSTPPPPRSLLAGIRQAGPGSQYILCLDDDVLLHPGLLASLVRDMEADPSLFMATGEPGAPQPGDARGLPILGLVRV